MRQLRKVISVWKVYFLPETFANVQMDFITGTSGGSVYVYFLTFILCSAHTGACKVKYLSRSRSFSFSASHCSSYTVQYGSVPFQWHKLIYTSCPPETDPVCTVQGHLHLFHFFLPGEIYERDLELLCYCSG